MSIDPHPNPNEDPEKHIGEVIPDPWSDPEQTDWPDEYVDIATGRVST